MNINTDNDSYISDDSNDLNSFPYNSPFMEKITLFEIKLYNDTIRPRAYFNKNFTFIPKNIYEILRIECKNVLNPLIEHGKFNECWCGFYGGVGHPDQNIYMYENAESIQFAVYIDFYGDWFDFYISDIDKKHAEKFSEYTDIINDIKKNLNDLWNNLSRDIVNLTHGCI